MDEIKKLKGIIEIYEISTKLDYKKIESLKDEINNYKIKIEKLENEILTLKKDFNITIFEYQK